MFWNQFLINIHSCLCLWDCCGRRKFSTESNFSGSDTLKATAGSVRLRHVSDVRQFSNLRSYLCIANCSEAIGRAWGENCSIAIGSANALHVCMYWACPFGLLVCSIVQTKNCSKNIGPGWEQKMFWLRSCGLIRQRFTCTCIKSLWSNFGWGCSTTPLHPTLRMWMKFLGTIQIQFNVKFDCNTVCIVY